MTPRPASGLGLKLSHASPSAGSIHVVASGKGEGRGEKEERRGERGEGRGEEGCSAQLLSLRTGVSQNLQVFPDLVAFSDPTQPAPLYSDMTVPMGILTAASGGFAVPSLAALLLHMSHPCTSVVTRTQRTIPSPCKRRRRLLLWFRRAQGLGPPKHCRRRPYARAPTLPCPKDPLPAAGHQGRSPSMHSTTVPRSGAGRVPAPAPSTSWGEDQDT